MFSIGSAELFVIFLVILFVVGPKRLPEIARMIGKAVRFFKQSLSEISQAIENEPSEELKQELSDYFRNNKEQPKNNSTDAG
jgi:Tat protein translocase TatB subunit